MAPTHFVLIHDACHGKWIWNKLQPLLEGAGHTVTAIDLVASGDDPRPIETVASADEYSKPLLNMLRAIPPGEKVILVGHGFGGISAAIAMDKHHEKVKLAVFLNALMPDTTNRPSHVIEEYMKVFDDWKDCEFGCYFINKGAISKITLGSTFVKDHLFQLCSVQGYNNAITKIKVGSFFPEPLAVREKFTEQGYGSIPRVFISSKEDGAIPTDFQKWEIDNFPVDRFYSIEADHSAMCSNPEGLSKILLEIAKTTSEQSA